MTSFHRCTRRTRLLPPTDTLTVWKKLSDNTKYLRLASKLCISNSICREYIFLSSHFIFPFFKAESRILKKNVIKRLTRNTEKNAPSDTLVISYLPCDNMKLKGNFFPRI